MLTLGYSQKYIIGIILLQTKHACISTLYDHYYKQRLQNLNSRIN